MRRVLEIGGIAAGAILILFGIASLVLSVQGKSTVGRGRALTGRRRRATGRARR